MTTEVLGKTVKTRTKTNNELNPHLKPSNGAKSGIRTPVTKMVGGEYSHHSTFAAQAFSMFDGRFFLRVLLRQIGHFNFVHNASHNSLNVFFFICT